MLLFDDLKRMITILEDNKINYYVFGGIALDGLRKTFTREHSDLDISIFSEDLENFFDIMNSKGYIFIKRENMYFLERETLKVGVIVLTKEKNKVIINGNKTIDTCPAEIFEKKNYGIIDGVKFSITPNEILTFDAKHSKHPKDRELGLMLKYNEELFNRIEHTIIRTSNNKS